MKEHYEDTIVSVSIASDARPTKVISVWRDSEGWWNGWAEPVTHVALVQRSWYTRPVQQLPGDPRQRRRFLRERERTLEPVTYDVNALGGFSTLSGLRDGACAGEYIDVIAADADWEDVMRTVQSAQSMQRSTAKAKAPVA